jgi:hypothetical protein
MVLKTTWELPGCSGRFSNCSHCNAVAGYQTACTNAHCCPAAVAGYQTAWQFHKLLNCVKDEQTCNSNNSNSNSNNKARIIREVNFRQKGWLLAHRPQRQPRQQRQQRQQRKKSRRVVPQFSIFTRESLQSSAGIHLSLLLLVLLLLLLLHVCLSFTL